MVAKNTAVVCKLKGRRRSTANRSLGRLFETLAIGYYRRLGFRLLERNRWFRFAEFDLLFSYPDNEQFLIVEVRGSRFPTHRPAQYFSARKQARLEKLADLLHVRYQKPVRVELLEIVGAYPTKAWRVPVVRSLLWRLPHLWGVQFRRIELEN